MIKIRISSEQGRGGYRHGALILVAVMGLAAFNGWCGVGDPDAPLPPRSLYNEGTQKFREGKLRDAEALLQSAVASQNERVQEPALYNLGHVRFSEGVEELKKGPNGQAAQAGAKHATESGTGAIRAADDALAGTDLNAMVSAYMRGRGARKELKSATEAVKKARESKAFVLGKWQRALGDFKSANELRPADKDAQANADVVDRAIAQLVDQQQMMMMNMAAMQQERGDLGKKMAELKQKMPAEMGQQLKGNGDDDEDEEENKPKEPKAGQEEGPSKDGQMMQLTVDEAERLLGMLRLDANRKLPLGGDEPSQPKDRKRRDW